MLAINAFMVAAYFFRTDGIWYSFRATIPCRRTGAASGGRREAGCIFQTGSPLPGRKWNFSVSGLSR